MTINPVYTKCPKCEATYSYTDIEPENTEGAEFWSDGFCMTPSRKEIIEFAKCPTCHTIFWLQDNPPQEQTDLSGIINLENSWPFEKTGAKELNFMKEAFRSGLANNNEKEILIRIKLWQIINHIIRKYDSQSFFKKIKQKFFETADFKDSLKLYNSNLSQKLNNLIRLANLLKMDENENTNYLLFAEIYRELGDFSKAMIFCYKAETTSLIEPGRILQLKQHITSKSKIAYKI